MAERCRDGCLTYQQEADGVLVCLACGCFAVAVNKDGRRYIKPLDDCCREKAREEVKRAYHDSDG